MEVETEGVRVLTVHASKGLEAPIVFLPDSCGGPDARHEPKLMRLSSPRPGDPPVLAWARKSIEDADAVAAARAEAREAQAGEHRRLLYVAMTRAAQRLIVAGYETSKRRPSDCWWDLVHSGLADALVEAPAPFRGGGTILRFGEGLQAEGLGETASRPRSPAPCPTGSSPVRRPRRQLPRSTLRAPAALVRATASGPSRDGLRMLCSRCCPISRRQRRPAAAAAYLDAWGGALAESARVALASKVLAAIDAPELSPIFSPGSRCEVALAGLLPRPGRPDLAYSGRLDRLVATDQGVLIVDFKLGEKPERPAAAHVAQLALYRAALQPLYRIAKIRAALVYLDGPTLTEISGEELDAALNDRRRNEPERAVVAASIPAFDCNSAGERCVDCLDEVAFAGQGLRVMTSGTRQGGRPTFICFGLGRLGRGPRRGSVCAAAGLSLAMLLAGGDLAAQAQKIPYGMVPYGRPVYKNGKTNIVAWRLAGRRA